MTRRFSVGDEVKINKLNVNGKIIGVEKKFFDNSIIGFAYIVQCANQKYRAMEYQLKKLD